MDRGISFRSYFSSFTITIFCLIIAIQAVSLPFMDFVIVLVSYHWLRSVDFAVRSIPNQS